MKTRYLILEDGSCYKGYAFGSDNYQVGELVFNTGMSGYQEVLSDLSYCGQIVMMTYPLIGNYGINRDDFESLNPAVFGFVVKEACGKYSPLVQPGWASEQRGWFSIPAVQRPCCPACGLMVRDTMFMPVILHQEF